MDGNIDVPRSIFGRNRNGREMRRRRQIVEMMLEKEGCVSGLCTFKTAPGMQPDVPDRRPFPQCCKICLPDAEVMIMDDIKELGLIDCFKPPTFSRHYSSFTRAFPFWNHYYGTCNFARFYQLPTWKDLSTDSKLLMLYSDEEKLSQEVKQTVLDVIKSLEVKKLWNAIFSPFILISTWLCQKYLAGFFESVLVHEGQIKLLKEVHSKKLPVIYIPQYQSHWDTTLILFALAHNGLPTPMFIPSYNSGSWITSYFGGIGSTLQQPSVNLDDDVKYSSAVACYLRQLLRKRNNLMLRLEHNASQTGRPSPLLYGTELLKIAYDEFISNNIEDLYFVPVSVSYENLPDFQSSTSYFSAGICKWFFRSCLSCILSPAKSLTAPKGCVRIDFSQPICLRELQKSLSKNSKITLADKTTEKESYHMSRDCTYLRWNPTTDSRKTLSVLYGTLAPLYPCSDNADETQRKEAITLDLLNHHLVYEAGKCGSTMPVHLVAFLLMKKSGGSMYLNQLVKELQWLTDILKRKKKDFGFAFNETDVMSIAYRGIQLLGETISCQWDPEAQDIKITPQDALNSLSRIEYFANQLLPYFILEGIVATVIFSMSGTQLTILRGYDAEVTMKDAEFISNCRNLYELFTCTFLLHPPCLSAEAAIRKQVSEMSDIGLLSLVRREVKHQHWEDGSDDEYYDEINPRPMLDQLTGFTFVPDEIKVTTANDIFDYLNFHRNLIIPFLEIYAFLTTSLRVLLDVSGTRKEMEMDRLETYLFDSLMRETDGRLKHCRQFISKDLIKCFLTTCEDFEIIFHTMQTGTSVKYYELEVGYVENNGSELDKQAESILFYVTK